MLKFLKNHSFVLTCFLALVLIPQSLTLQSKLEGRLIITGLAIDKENDAYVVTAQAVSPSSGVISGSDAAGIDFISTSAKTIREAITKIATTATKSPGLGHLNFVIIGSSLFGEDLTSAIDFIVRDSHTDTSVLMLVAENAGEELKKTKSLELGSAIQLRKYFLSKNNMSNGAATITNKFISSKFEPSASCAINYLEIYSEKQIQQPNAQMQNGTQEQMTMDQGSSPGSGGEIAIKQGRIKYNSKIALFRDGKHRCDLSEENEILGYNMLCGNSTNTIFGFNDLTESNGTKTKITLLSRKKRSKVSVKIKDGKPKICAKISLSDSEVLELIPSETKQENYKTQQNYLTKEMQDEISQQIAQAATAAFVRARENQVDILGAATKLHRHNKTQYNNYFGSHTLNDFLGQAEFSVLVNIENSAN